MQRRKMHKTQEATDRDIGKHEVIPVAINYNMNV